MIKRLVCLGITILILASCAPAPANPTAAPQAATPQVATPQVATQVYVPVAGGGGAPRPGQTPQIFLPVLQGSQGDQCQTPITSLTLAATATTVKVGDAVTVTATLANQGCAQVGLPQYSLSIHTNTAQPVLDPANPNPVKHELGISQGQADAAIFVLRAIAPGQATLNAAADFEARPASAGAAYGANATAQPLIINVTQ